jgi:rhamnosyltransferase
MLLNIAENKNKNKITMKFAAIVVTYFPDKEEFVKNTESYIDFVDALYIWDNTPIEERNEEMNGGISVIKEKYLDKVFVFENDKNVGLAYAYNRGIEKAKKDDFTHIMTMDQDSFFQNFVGYKNNIEKETNPDIGIMVPIHNRETEIIAKHFEPWEQSDFVQSGTVFSLPIFDKVGLFREELFIYFIEPEFMFRAKKMGYKCFGYGNNNMIHKFGNPADKTNKFFNTLTLTPKNSGTLSTFYRVRNGIWLNKNYPKECKSQRMYYNPKVLMKREVKNFFIIILSEKNKIAKIHATLRGLFHGLFINIKRGFT